MKYLLILCGCLFLCNSISAQSSSGKYIVNGKAYPAEDVIQQLYTFGNQLPGSERRFLSCIQDALKQGRTLEYNTWSYTLKGYVNWGSQLTSSQQRKYAKKRNTSQGLPTHVISFGSISTSKSHNLGASQSKCKFGYECTALSYIFGES